MTQKKLQGGHRGQRKTERKWYNGTSTDTYPSNEEQKFDYQLIHILKISVTSMNIQNSLAGNLINLKTKQGIAGPSEAERPLQSTNQQSKINRTQQLEKN